MKKIFSIILTVTLCISLSSVFTSAATASQYYSDVYTTDAYFNAAEYLYEHNVLKGTTTVTSTSKATFSPTISVTRGQIVTILWRMLDEPDPDGTVTSFSDCNSSHMFYDAVSWGSSSNIGIVTGFTDGTFLPSKAVTYQEALTFLYRFVCYCGYSSNNSTMQTHYTNVLSNSSYTNKASFSTFAKPAAGWAIENKILTDTYVSPTASCPRSSAALFVYRIYTVFQEKYGIVVAKDEGSSTSTDIEDTAYFGDCATVMLKTFVGCGASCTFLLDITKAEFVQEMENVFSDAKKLDMCYIFMASHGNATYGLGLFTDSGTGGYLTPTKLRTEIDKYDGMFVVMISGCYSGTYIDTESGTTYSLNETEDEFDAELFVYQLINGADSNASTYSSSNLKDSNRIKVLCSSGQDEKSYKSIDYATKYWALGSGFNKDNNSYVTPQADTNGDSRVSLTELHIYSRDTIASLLNGRTDINGDPCKQTVVCYSTNLDFIIIETGY